MAYSLTQKQRIATDPNVSARVMANAGAGKTFVLTARVLRLLLKNVHPGKILCLTYTKAAAAEMRERINARLEEWVLMDDDKLRREIANLIEAEPDEKQMAIAKKLFSSTLESSPPPRIQTIHSFCQDVLKRFPLESGIQPYFEVADEVSARELIQQTTQVLLSKDDAAVDYIAAHGGEWKFNEVVGEIISQRNRIRDLFDSAESVDEIIEFIYRKNGLDPQVSAKDMSAKFFDFSAERLANVKMLGAALLNSANKNDNARGEVLLRAVAERDFDEYALIFLTKENAPRKNIITKEGKKFLPHAEEITVYEQTAVSEIIDNAIKIENLEFTKNVIYLAHGILQAYEALKHSRALIDYNDLIYSTKKLLTSGNAAWVLYKLDGGIDHILVDEAQDTSPDQWQIILALLEEFMAGEGAARGERTIFVVGDEKQSIYSFQGADQKKFNQVIKFIQDKCIAAQKPFNEIELETSFRSVAAVLKVTDTVFAPEHLRKSISSRSGAVEHLLDRKAEGGHVELWPLVKNEEKAELENWQLPVSYHTAKSADLLLAEKIADTIAEWLGSGRKLVSQNRAVRPSDILILLRSRGNLADMLINRLKRNGVEVSGSDRLKITEHIAIQDLVALGNFLLLPADDLSLASVLKSPLFGINEEELFELCYKREGSLWNNLRNNKKFAATEKELSDLLAKVDFIPVYNLLSLVLDEMGGRKKFISRLGHEVNDVLDEFLDLAVNFERAHTSSMQHFLHWVQLSNMEIKRDMEAAGEQVRIMTVHGAKGLEAPVVFIADAAKLPQPKRQLIWDNDNSWPHFYSYKSKSRLSKNLREAVELAEGGDYDEYLRLLYVAITRARDELYICGSVGERNTDIEESWYRIAENAMAKIGVKNEDSGVVRYETAHQKPIVEKPLLPPRLKTVLPEFLHKKLAAETSEVAEIENGLEFSDMVEQIDYGSKVHKVLEIAADIPVEKRDAYIDAVFADDAKTRDSLKKLFTAPEFAGIFAAGTSEVPVIGRIDGKIVAGRIDRLVVTGDTVTIVDFKTARNVPEQVPQSYINQMDVYSKIIAPQYPGHKIRKFILWTSAPKLEPLA